MSEDRPLWRLGVDGRLLAVYGRSCNNDIFYYFCYYYSYYYIQNVTSVCYILVPLSLSFVLFSKLFVNSKIRDLSYVLSINDGGLITSAYGTLFLTSSATK